MVGIKGVALEEDSGRMTDNSFVVEGGGEGGGKVIISSAHCALFGGGVEVPATTIPFQAARAASANLFLPLPAISTQK